MVGRYLEHAEYIFGVGDGQGLYFIGGFYDKNTLRRIEVAAPVYDHTKILYENISNNAF